jgi:hypothetical protein
MPYADIMYEELVETRQYPWRMLLKLLVISLTMFSFQAVNSKYLLVQTADGESGGSLVKQGR